jgi:hypothetical protein
MAASLIPTELAGGVAVNSGVAGLLSRMNSTAKKSNDASY